MSLSAKIEVGSDKVFYGEHLWESVPIFFQPFYLDVVCPYGWQVVYVLVSGKMVAIMPVPFDHNTKFIRKPPFSIYQGPYLNPSEEFDLTDQMIIIQSLLDALPPFRYYNQNWHPAMKNWLPFFWQNFVQSTRYSYAIFPDSIERVRQRYNQNVRRNVKKAANLAVHSRIDVDELYKIIQKTFDRKQQTNPINKKLLKDLLRSCELHHCARVLFATDASGATHAAMLLIFDKKSIYYLAGGIDPRYKNSGAMTLLFDTAIAWAMTEGKTFDFEGSMIPSIEAYFRSFGSVQQQYFVITKARSIPLTIRLQLAKWVPWLAPF